MSSDAEERPSRPAADTTTAVGNSEATADGAAPPQATADDDGEPTADGAAAPQATADDDGGPTPDGAAASQATGKANAAKNVAEDIYRVELEGFEGPLDLLLHLIQKHELDILDIPISFITTKYLDYLNWMNTLQLDVASEYLVMAATLALIKSKMLLPEQPSEGEADEEVEPLDPRAELVRRLLEYQKYKQAAAQLQERPTLGRDVFTRGSQETESEGPAPFAPVNVFKLFDAFDSVLKRAKQSAEHEVLLERISIAERIVELTELLHDRGRVLFEQLFEVDDPETGEASIPSKYALVLTFLAVLEMCRRHIIRVIQEQPLSPLYVEFYMGPAEPQRAKPLGLGPSDLARSQESAPAVTTAIEVTPTENAPTEDEDAPTEDAPTEDAPTEDAPTEDNAPTEDEDAPTEDNAPTEDEDAPTEDEDGPTEDEDARPTKSAPAQDSQLPAGVNGETASTALTTQAVRPAQPLFDAPGPRGEPKRRRQRRSDRALPSRGRRRRQQRATQARARRQRRRKGAPKRQNERRRQRRQ